MSSRTSSENIADQYFEGFCRGAKISKDDIIIRRDFLNLVGGNLTEAAIFSRIMHYQPYLKEQDRDELAKNHTDWQQECGVTSSAARKAIKRLEEKSLITTRVDKFEGKNAVFIKVDRVHFYEQMTGEHLLQKDTSPVTKGQVHLLQKDRSIYKEDIQGIQQGKESPLPPAKVEGKQAGSDKPTPEGQKKKAKSKPRTPQQYRAQLEETEQQRWDILFKALEIGLHGIDLKSLPPAAKARYAPLIHKQVRIAIEFPWLTADDIESFLQWYKKENGGLLPTSEAGFAKWICQYAAQRSELSAHKTPDKNCSTCNGAGQVILKRGSITEAAEYGKCPTCMVEGKTA